MTPEQIEQIIDTLAEKLGPMAVIVWQAYVRQVYVNVLGGALWVVGFLAAAFGCWALTRKCKAVKDSVDREFLTVIAYIGVIVCVALAFCSFTFDVLKVLNPEYWAIQMLLGR